MGAYVADSRIREASDECIRTLLAYCGAYFNCNNNMLSSSAAAAAAAAAPTQSSVAFGSTTITNLLNNVNQSTSQPLRVHCIEYLCALLASASTTATTTTTTTSSSSSSSLSSSSLPRRSHVEYLDN